MSETVLVDKGQAVRIGNRPRDYGVFEKNGMIMCTNNPDHNDMSFDNFDEANFPRPDSTDFEMLADVMISRRAFIGGGAALGLTTFVLGTRALTPPAHAASRLGFRPVIANTLDTITLPKGYSWQVVAKWGDPMWRNGAALNTKILNG